MNILKMIYVISVPNNIELLKNYLSTPNISMIILSGGGDIKSNKLSKGQH